MIKLLECPKIGFYWAVTVYKLQPNGMAVKTGVWVYRLN